MPPSFMCRLCNQSCRSKPGWFFLARLSVVEELVLICCLFCSGGTSSPAAMFLPDPRWASPECHRSSAAPSCNFHGPSALRRRSKCGRTGGCLSRFPGSFPPERRVHRTRTCDRNKGIIKILIVVIITTTTSCIMSRQTGSSRRQRAVTGTCKLAA